MRYNTYFSFNFYRISPQLNRLKTFQSCIFGLFAKNVFPRGLSVLVIMGKLSACNVWHSTGEKWKKFWGLCAHVRIVRHTKVDMDNYTSTQSKICWDGTHRYEFAFAMFTKWNVGWVFVYHLSELIKTTRELPRFHRHFYELPM